MDPDICLSKGGAPPVRGFRVTAVATLLAAFAAVFVLGFMHVPGFGVQSLGLYVAHVRAWAIVTHVFHQVHPALLAINLAVLWFFGRALEREWGGPRFAALYLLTAAASGLITLAAASLTGATHAVVCGATGGSFGIILLTGIIWADEIVLGRFALRHVAGATLALLFPALWTIQTLTFEQGGLDLRLLPQASGLAFAVLFYYVEGRISMALERRWLERQLRQLQEEFEARERVDRLLEKISAEGMENLSRREIHFLRSASRYYRGRR